MDGDGGGEDEAAETEDELEQYLLTSLWSDSWNGRLFELVDDGEWCTPGGELLDVDEDDDKEDENLDELNEQMACIGLVGGSGAVRLCCGKKVLILYESCSWA